MRRSIAVAAFLAAACAPSLAAAQGTRFRITDLDLRDPHVWVSVIGCNDVTDVAVNSQLQTAITTDGDGDGFLDASTLLEFLPLDQSAATNLFDSGGANCTVPAASTQCDAIAQPVLAGNATLSTTTVCGQPLAGTVVHVYSPQIANSVAPCFASVTGNLTIGFAGVPLTLSNAQIAATFSGGPPATSLSNGLLRGFLSEADANATVIPATVPVVGGRTVASILAGGTGACPVFSDKDTGPGGVIGWYFYLNFPAQKLIEGTFANGFADGFE